MIKKMPFVSIVVASYNRRYIIGECIDALLNQSYPSEYSEIVIVDNNSTDGTIEFIHETYCNEIKSGKIKVLALKINSGSAGSYNYALEKVYKNWDYFLKMDEDLVLELSCIEKMVECAEQYPESGIIGGKVLLYRDRSRFHAIGSYLRPYYAISKGIGVNKIDKGQYNSIRTIDGLNGCMILISKKVKEKVGWFDSDYFMYYDDHDIMFKCLKNGFKNYYTPFAIGYHDTHTSTLKKFSNSKWIFYSTRGSWMFYHKNFKKISKEGLFYFLGMHLLFSRAVFNIFRINKSGIGLKTNLKLFFQSYIDGMMKKTKGMSKTI